ncbi:hypothetical protein U91I_01080 [alpha proteobacterium U9-1i]|nr:hypothetical protein U91I_01080 [alpha proteobacterium U9-1i]
MSTSDDFASRFDSIPVEKAQAFVDAPAGDDPLAAGFTLLDDAGGRFAIERETGIITVPHDETLTADAGRAFDVTLRCVEFSGLTYTQTLRLCVTGRVPQIVGDAVNDALSRLASGSLWDDAPIIPARRRVAMAFATAQQEPEALTRSDWSKFAVFHAHPARRPLGDDGVFGALVGVELPPVHVDATLALTAKLPTPAAADASWTL